MMRIAARRSPSAAQPHRSISRAIRAAKSARIHHRSVHVRNGAFSTQSFTATSARSLRSSIGPTVTAQRGGGRPGLYRRLDMNATPLAAGGPHRRKCDAQRAPESSLRWWSAAVGCRRTAPRCMFGKERRGERKRTELRTREPGRLPRGDTRWGAEVHAICARAARSLLDYVRFDAPSKFKVDSKKTIKKSSKTWTCSLEHSERSNPQAGGRRHTGSGAGEGRRWRQCQSHTPPSPPRRARRNNSAASSRRTRCAHGRRTDSLATSQRRGALPCSAAERKRPRERVDAASRRNLQPQLRRGGAASRRWSALGDSAR